MKEQDKKTLQDKFGAAVLLDEPMKSHTTFRVGGCAAAFIEIKGESMLRQALSFVKEQNIPYYLLGNGSNVLCSDQGFDGVILHIGKDYSEITVENSGMDAKVTAQAGALLSKVANVAAAESLTGLEFAAGIPGSIGGAIYMNAGAYDGEMKMVVESVRVLTQDGEIQDIPGAEMDFSYRHSICKDKGYIVLATTCKLRTGDAQAIRDKMQDFAGRRKDKQPLEFPSAGSTFKRPEGYFAGKLIQDAGLRGYTVGGAQVSEKHCGFVINKGDATAMDVWNVIQDVREKVRQDSGITLEPEVIFLGEFPPLS